MCLDLYDSRAIGILKGIKKVSDIDTNWNARQEIWAAIRVLRAFSVVDIRIVCPEIGHDIIRKFVFDLASYGYLRNVGRRGRFLAYRLIKDTGPLYPVKSKGRLKDRNTGEIVEKVR